MAVNAKIYRKVNGEVEQLSYKLSIFVYGIVAPFMICPAVFQSYYQYYMLDMGGMSFSTPFPAS